MRWTPGLLVFAFLGGLVGGLFYELGRETRFRCDKCKNVFRARGVISWVFFLLCVLTYIVVATMIAYGLWCSVHKQ
jgi:hypothetical protein